MIRYIKNKMLTNILEISVFPHLNIRKVSGVTKMYVELNFCRSGFCVGA